MPQVKKSTKIEKHHPKYINAIDMMFFNKKNNYSFYAAFNHQVNFIEKKNDPHIKTAGVNITTKGMFHYYNPEFLNGLTQEGANFLLLHETYHLLYSHPKRTRMGGYDAKLANWAQDMIINYNLLKFIDNTFISIPLDKEGKRSALFPPAEYGGELVFEDLYDFIRVRKEENENHRKKKEDEKIFEELFVMKGLPSDTVKEKDYSNALNNLRACLTKASAKEVDKYIGNFVKKCYTSAKNDKKVKLFAHSSSVIPDGEPDEYNSILTENRVLMFKNGVVDAFSKYIETYMMSYKIAEVEAENLSEDNMTEYCIAYEEIGVEIMKKQRAKEIKKLSLNEITILFTQYRMSELSAYNKATLIKLLAERKIDFEITDDIKAAEIDMMDQMLEIHAVAFEKPIILNDTDDQLSNLGAGYAKNSKYKSFINVTDPEIKQEINRRLSYEFDEEMSNGMGGGSSPEQSESDYGAEHGMDEIDTWSLDKLLENAESGDEEAIGELDQHIEDEVSPELREDIVSSINESLRNRGFVTNEIEEMLGKLRKKKKDYLKTIKSGITFVKGFKKAKTFKRPNRRSIQGLKGKYKYGGTKLTVLLDTSGSMSGYHEKALSYIFRQDIVVDLIQCDTEIKEVENIKTMKQLQGLKLTGFGGTELQPGIDFAVKNYPNQNMVILGDGYCDSLDFSKFRKKVLLISVGQEHPISASNGRIRQIVTED